MFRFTFGLAERKHFSGLSVGAWKFQGQDRVHGRFKPPGRTECFWALGEDQQNLGGQDQEWAIAGAKSPRELGYEAQAEIPEGVMRSRLCHFHSPSLLWWWRKQGLSSPLEDRQRLTSGPSVLWSWGYRLDLECPQILTCGRRWLDHGALYSSVTVQLAGGVHGNRQSLGKKWPSPLFSPSLPLCYLTAMT